MGIAPVIAINPGGRAPRAAPSGPLGGAWIGGTVHGLAEVAEMLLGVDRSTMISTLDGGAVDGRALVTYVWVSGFRTLHRSEFDLAGLGRSIRLLAGAARQCLAAHGDAGSVHAQIESLRQVEMVGGFQMMAVVFGDLRSQRFRGPIIIAYAVAGASARATGNWAWKILRCLRPLPARSAPWQPWRVFRKAGNC